ncbi:MAG: biotin/lipoyl-binding protein, partial [Saprospiraceae bacterium]|nr:biotin/lipoyl-binding protein [Saprospiraceae bacterium]
TVIAHRKAESENEVGSPLPGNLSQILVNEGDEVKIDDPLFVIEAMKMESTITSPIKGVIKKVHLSEKTIVGQDDLVVEF